MERLCTRSYEHMKLDSDTLLRTLRNTRQYASSACQPKAVDQGSAEFGLTRRQELQTKRSFSNADSASAPCVNGLIPGDLAT